MNLISIQTLNDGQIVRSLLAYEDYASAASALYYTISSNIVDTSVKSIVCVLLNDKGYIEKQETYIKQDTPEPNDDVEE